MRSAVLRWLNIFLFFPLWRISLPKLKLQSKSSIRLLSLSVASPFQRWATRHRSARSFGLIFFFFFLRELGCPSHVLQRLLGLFRVHVVLPRPRAEVQVRGPLRAALLVAGEEAKPVRTDGRQKSVSMSAWRHHLTCDVSVLHFTAHQYQ